MKAKINGDVVTIESCINYAKLKEVAPIFIRNDDGKKVYGVDVNSCAGAIAEVGTTFSFPNADGNACLNILVANPADNPEQIKKDLLAGMAKELTALKMFEREACAEIDDALTARDELAALIEVR